MIKSDVEISIKINFFDQKIHFLIYVFHKFYHDVRYLKNPILKNSDFEANMYHMNMVFRFLESLLLRLSLECFFIIFGHFFEILCHFEFDVYFRGADSFSIPQKIENDESHLKYHPMNLFFVC